MRKLVIFCMVLVGCDTYKSYLINDDLCNFDDPIFTLKEEEKSFDMVKYRSTIDSILNVRERCVLLNNEQQYVDLYVWSHNKAIIKTVKNKKNKIIKSIGYDSLGRIRSFSNEHIYSSDYLQKKIHYYPDGSVEKFKDYRKADKYPICYKEALAIVARKKRRKDSITRLHKAVYKRGGKKYFVWDVHTKIPKRFGKGQSRYYKVDAQTGKILLKGITRVVPAEFKY